MQRLILESPYSLGYSTVCLCNNCVGIQDQTGIYEEVIDHTSQFVAFAVPTWVLPGHRHTCFYSLGNDVCQYSSIPRRQVPVQV